MRNRVKAPVEAIGTYRLILDTRHHLDLFQILYVPSVSRNLVSLSKLDIIGYSFKFGNGCSSQNILFKHNHFIGSGILCDDLYKLKLDNLFVETLLTLNEPQEACSFLKLYTPIYVGLLMFILLEEKNILSPLLMNFHVMTMSNY
ncbi:hypothetical protein ACOSP7_021604 [Xanthoceras sorbifolium]